MLIYLAAPYSNVEDKDELMKKIMTYSGAYMLENKGSHIVSPLFNHYSLEHVPELGGTYEFWEAYSAELLGVCRKMIVLTLPGWTKSKGVQSEMMIAKSRSIPVEFVELCI
jgi:hypothetical protein